MDPADPVAARRHQLVVLAVALVLAMSTWFSTAAVLGQLKDSWSLSDTAGAWLTIMVQLGFVAGAGLSSLTNLADRIPPRRLLLFGATGAAATNAALALVDGLSWALPLRFVTGAFLAAVYPPVVLGVGLVWGYWVVADSAQFSTVVTEVTDSRYVGRALTMQLAIGFVLTVFTIFLVPVVRDAAGWGWAFALLAPGPLLGSWAMRRLRSLGPAPPAGRGQARCVRQPLLLI